MSVVKFPGPSKPKHKRSTFRKCYSAVSDVEGAILDIATPMWLLVHLDYLPEGKELVNLRGWLEWEIFDKAAAAKKAYYKAHKRMVQLGRELEEIAS